MFLMMNDVSSRFFTSRAGKYVFGLSDSLFSLMFDVLVKVGAISFSVDTILITSDRGKVLIEEALRRAWGAEVLHLFGYRLDACRITFPSGKHIVFSGLPRPNTHTDMATGWIDDKILLKRHLVKAEVPVSRGNSATTFDEALRIFEGLEKPVIVKPRLGSRGRHTTTHLHTEDELKHAFRVAQMLGKHVVVEEHLEGSVYRATMVDGKLVGVLAGDPPRVTGDGVSSIQELITKKNTSRHPRVGEVRITDKLIEFLSRQGLTLDTVLKKEITIDLSEKIGLSYGGNAREVTSETHPQLKEELERAARAVGDPLIGFDFISTDITKDPSMVRWGIIECNTLPFINLHHDPLEGEPVNVAGKVLDFAERTMGK